MTPHPTQGRLLAPVYLRGKSLWPLATASLLAVAGGAAIAIGGPTAFFAQIGLLGAIALFLATFVRPVWLLWLTIVTVPLLTVHIDLGFQVLTLPEVFFFASIGMWLVSQLVRKRLTLRSSPMNLPAALFGLLYVISFARMPHVTLRSFDIGGDKLLYGILVGLMMYVVTSNALRSRSDILILVSAWPIAGMLAVIIGFQYYFSGQQFMGRLISSLEQEHGPYLLYIGALILGLLAPARDSGRQTVDGPVPGLSPVPSPVVRRLSSVLWLCLGLFGVQMFLNGYRGVWMAMGLILAGYLLWNLKRRWILGLTLAALLILGIWTLFGSALSDGNGLPPVLERALSSFSLDDRAAGARMLAWRFAAELIGESPIIGVGLDTFRERYLRLSLPSGLTMGERGIATHNMYLDVLLEVGLIGLAVLIWLLVAAFKRQRELLRRTANDPVLQGVVLGIGFMLISFLAWGFTNSPLHKLLTANLNIFAALGLLNAVHAVLTKPPEVAA